MTGAVQHWSAHAILFDLDGTLVDSESSIRAAWTALASKRSLGVEDVIRHLPGRRAIDVLTHFGLAADEIAADIRWLEREQVKVNDVEALQGALNLINILPPAQWAVVTAAPESVARARLSAARLPMPSVLIAAEAVERGKPYPDGFVQAADALGMMPQECVVFEDAGAGVEAARAAGCRVIGVGTHPTGADQQVEDYTRLLDPRVEGGRLLWSIDHHDLSSYSEHP